MDRCHSPVVDLVAVAVLHVPSLGHTHLWEDRNLSGADHNLCLLVESLLWVVGRNRLWVGRSLAVVDRIPCLVVLGIHLIGWIQGNLVSSDASKRLL